jgi:hypothetical protein
LEAAIRGKRKILVVHDKNYKFTKEDMTEDWQKHQKIVFNDYIAYGANTECVEKIIAKIPKH